jgi:hypothetical protein
MQALNALLLQHARTGVQINKLLSTIKRDASARYFTYVLLLQRGNIYVGSSESIYKRLLDHYTRSPSSSLWVKEHGPIERVLEICVDSSADDERYKTLEYMSVFGHEKVRGGGWCRVASAGPPADLADFARGRSDFTYLSRKDIDAIMKEVEAMAEELADN